MVPLKITRNPLHIWSVPSKFFIRGSYVTPQLTAAIQFELMARDNKFCMELPFNRSVSYSQRIKARELWNFLNSESRLKPYVVPSVERASKENEIKEASSPPPKIWHEQLKVFQEHGLDKVARAAYEKCELCSIKLPYESSDCTDTKEQEYEELLQEMEAFDNKLKNKPITGIEPKEKEPSTK